LRKKLVCSIKAHMDDGIWSEVGKIVLMIGALAGYIYYKRKADWSLLESGRKRRSRAVTTIEVSVLIGLLLFIFFVMPKLPMK